MTIVALVFVYFLEGQRWVVVASLAINSILFALGIFLEKERENHRKNTDDERSRLAELHIGELRDIITQSEKEALSLRQAKERFRHSAFHDALTDLPNRNLFIETLKFVLEKYKQRDNFNFAVLSLDINRFKTINDSLGHSFGDRLIKEVANRLGQSMREGDLVARFSGDEFSIILNDISGIQDAVEFAKVISSRLSMPFDVDGRQIFSSVSIGVAAPTINRFYEEADEVLRDADIAMYYAKARDKEVEVFDHAMHVRALTLLQLETDLRSALENNEFSSYFQPIVALDSMKLVGFEALIRWNHPVRGLVSPVEFIPVCEDTGLIVPLTIWMFRESCRKLLELQYKTPESKTLFLSLNLSGKHFAQQNLVAEVQRILVETQIDPAHIKLEITESAVMENAERVITMLNEFKALGLSLSIDDFGTGYSSLSYLHRFPTDTLKVDRSFVRTMEDATDSGEIVRTIISLAKQLNMKVVAEGVETIHQLHQLRVLGCEFGQGYLFSRPLPFEQVEKLVEEPDRWLGLLPAENVHPFTGGQSASNAPYQV